jgi:hypothetical protein
MYKYTIIIFIYIISIILAVFVRYFKGIDYIEKRI